MTSLEVIQNVKYMKTKAEDNLRIIDNMIDIEDEMSISKAHFLGEKQTLKVMIGWFDKLIDKYFEDEVREHELTILAEFNRKE